MKLLVTFKALDSYDTILNMVAHIKTDFLLDKTPLFLSCFRFVFFSLLSSFLLTAGENWFGIGNWDRKYLGA